MTEPGPLPLSTESWRDRLFHWRSAVIRTIAPPASVTLLSLDGEQVAQMLRQSGERTDPPQP